MCRKADFQRHKKSFYPFQTITRISLFCGYQCVRLDFTSEPKVTLHFLLNFGRIFSYVYGLWHSSFSYSKNNLSRHYIYIYMENAMKYFSKFLEERTIETNIANTQRMNFVWQILYLYTKCRLFRCFISIALNEHRM